jgi:multidrug efflux pump subunit AcrB
MWLIKASLRNPYMVATIVFMILVLGLLSLISIPVDILPVFKSPAVQTLTYYQGMPASSIEKTITNRIERWVNQAPGVEKIESKSVPGVSVVKSYFRGDVNPNAALTVTNSLALGTLATLPPNTLPPVVLPFDPTGTLPLGVLTVSNPSLDEAHVKDLARIDVRNMLGAVPGCVAPVVIGGKDRTVLIYLDPPKLQAHGLSPIDVVQALQKGNVMVTPGTAYFGNNQVLLDTNVMVNKVKELNDLPIVMQPGHQVYLRDIGHAEDSYAIQTSRVRIDGRRQVYVPIYRQQGASSLSVANGVKEHVKYMEERLPAGTKLDFVMDQTISVREAIKSLIHEGIIGAVLVSLMILIFLGNWRMTVIASLSIPLAVLGSIIGLYATGNTINLMVLGGLALAIGPLVDDAIVALENIHRNYDLCKSRMRAAWIGSIEVMVPVLVATCTTSIVLAPLALMPGMGGFLFRPLALAVTFAMFSSFFLSRTFVPMMCAKFLPEEHAHPSGASEADGIAHGCVDTAHDRGGLFSYVHRRIEWFLTGMTRRYERVLAWALAHRAPVLTVVGLLFVGSLCLAAGIGREFFPQVDAGQLTMYVRAPSNLRLDATERRIMAVEQFLERAIPPAEREMIVSEIGLDPDWSAAYTPNSGQQDGVVRVQFSDRRTMSAQEYAVKLRHLLREDSSFSDLRVAFDTGGMVSTALNYGVSSPIDIQIEGGTLDEGRRLAREIRRQVRAVQGAADTRVMQRLDAPYLIIDVDRKKAAEAGLSAVDVINQVVAAMNSSISISHNFWIDVSTGNQYFVGVQYPENPNMQLADMLNVPATGANQTHTVYLRNLVNIRHSNDAVEINHVSLYRVFDVMVNSEGRDIAGVAGDVQGRLREVQKNAWLAEADRLQADAVNSNLSKDKQQQAANQAKEIKEDLPNLLRVDQGVWSFPHRQRVKLMGEYERMNTSFHDLVIGLALAAVLVYLLQVALFRSWVGPFIIMFTVPLGLIGVLTMLFVTHTTLNVQSEMGVIFLVGIAVNNGVLLVEFANKQRRLGASVHRAIATAAGIRFRPIMMTFLATFLDLIPMAIGVGRGSEATIPLARAVVGGLLTSTCLTLLVVPIMYTLLIRDQAKTELDIEAELAEEPVRTIAGPVASGTGNGDTMVIATASALARRHGEP